MVLSVGAHQRLKAQTDTCLLLGSMRLTSRKRCTGLTPQLTHVSTIFCIQRCIFLLSLQASRRNTPPYIIPESTLQLKGKGCTKNHTLHFALFLKWWRLLYNPQEHGRDFTCETDSLLGTIFNCWKEEALQVNLKASQWWLIQNNTRRPLFNRP